MQPQNRPYGLLSVFAFILAGVGYLVHQLVTTAGYLTLNGANNISNIYDFDRAAGQQFMDLYLKHQTEQHFTFYEWTIGSFNNVPGLLGIIFAVAGVILGILFIIKRK